MYIIRCNAPLSGALYVIIAGQAIRLRDTMPVKQGTLFAVSRETFAGGWDTSCLRKMRDGVQFQIRLSL
jgi:hypothetical protein